MLELFLGTTLILSILGTTLILIICESRYFTKEEDKFGLILLFTCPYINLLYIFIIAIKVFFKKIKES